MASDPASRLNEASASAEKTLEDQMQKLVGSDAFGQMLAQTMGTSMGLVKLANDGAETFLRSMRIPTQGELTRIAGQIARLEDKLEDVLIAVERLEDRIAAPKDGGAPARGRKAGA